MDLSQVYRKALNAIRIHHKAEKAFRDDWGKGRLPSFSRITDWQWFDHDGALQHTGQKSVPLQDVIRHKFSNIIQKCFCHLSCVERYVLLFRLPTLGWAKENIAMPPCGTLVPNAHCVSCICPIMAWELKHLGYNPKVQYNSPIYQFLCWCGETNTFLSTGLTPPGVAHRFLTALLRNPQT